MPEENTKMTVIDVVKCEVATLSNPDLRLVYALIPAVVKKCNEVKKEVTTRIRKEGNLEDLKEYEEPAGVKVTDLTGFLAYFAEYIDKDTFVKECCTVNLTAFKKIVVPVIQELKLKQGEKVSKQVIETKISQKALEFGEQKTKKTII